MESAPCPECNYEITLPRPREGQRLACPQCGSDLEVISALPLELDWAYIEPEDDWGTLDADDDYWDESWDSQQDDDLEDEDDEDDDWDGQ